MTNATLEGEDIKATTPLPGIDWFTPHSPDFGRPHVRIPFQTDDGALLLMEYRGIVHATDTFKSAVDDNTATQWEDQYMRMAIMFDTTSTRYAWLVRHLFWLAEDCSRQRRLSTKCTASSERRTSK